MAGQVYPSTKALLEFSQPFLSVSGSEPSHKLLDPSEKERLKSLFQDQTYVYRFRVEGLDNPIEFSFDLRIFFRECKEFFSERGIEILDFYCKGGGRGYVLGERDDDLADLDLTLEIEDPGENWKTIENTYLEFLCYTARIASIPDDKAETITYCCGGKPLAQVKQSKKFRDGQSLFLNGGLLNKCYSSEGFFLFKLPTQINGKERPIDIDFAASKDRKFLRKHSSTGSDDCIYLKITHLFEDQDDTVWNKDFYAHTVDGVDIHKSIRNSRLRVVEADLQNVATVHEGFRIHCKKLTEGKIYPSFLDADIAYLKALEAEYDKKWNKFDSDLKKFVDEHFKEDTVSQLLYLLDYADIVERSHLLTLQNEETICNSIFGQLSYLLKVHRGNYSLKRLQREFTACRTYLYLVLSSEGLRPRSIFAYGERGSLYILPVKERRCLNFAFSSEALNRDLRNMEQLVKESPLAFALTTVFPANRHLGNFGIEKANTHFEPPQPILKDYFKDIESFILHYSKFDKILDKQRIIEVQSYLFELLHREKNNPKISVLHEKVANLLHHHASICKGRATDKIFGFLMEFPGFFTLAQVRQISICLVTNRLRKGRIEKAILIYTQIATLRSDAGELLKDLMKKILDKRRNTPHALLVFKPLLQAALKKNSYFCLQNELLKDCLFLLSKNPQSLHEAFRFFITYIQTLEPSRMKGDFSAGTVLDLFFIQYERLSPRAKEASQTILCEELAKIPAFDKDENIQARLQALLPEKGEDLSSELCEFKERDTSVQKEDKAVELFSFLRQNLLSLVNRMHDRQGIHRSFVKFKDLFDSILEKTSRLENSRVEEFHRFLLLQEQRVWEMQERAPHQVISILDGFLHLHVRFSIQHQGKKVLKTPFLDILKQHLKKETLAIPHLNWDSLFHLFLVHLDGATELIQFCDSQDHSFMGKILTKIVQTRASMVMDWTLKSIRPIQCVPLFDINVQLLKKASQYLTSYLQRKKQPDVVSDSLLKESVHLAFLLSHTQSRNEIDAFTQALLKIPFQKGTSLPTGWSALNEKMKCLSQLSAIPLITAQKDVSEDVSLFTALIQAHKEKEQGNSMSAIGYFEIAIDKLPEGDHEIYVEVALLYKKQGQTEMACSILNRGIARYPTEPRFHVIYAELYLGIAEAIELSDPENNQKNKESTLFNCRSAIKHYSHCLPWGNKIPNIFINMGKCYQIIYAHTKDIKMCKEAYKYYKAYSEKKPKDEVVLVILGEICCTFKDYRMAQHYFTKAMEADPNCKRAYSHLSQVHKIIKKAPEEGIAFLDKAIKQFPDEGQFYAERGAILQPTDIVKASKDFAMAFRLKPEYKKLLQNEEDAKIFDKL